jgi:protein involved in polysaccharide export with SLBB domain
MKRICKLALAAFLTLAGTQGLAIAQDAVLPGPTAGAVLPGGQATAPSAPIVVAPVQSAGVADDNYRLGTGDKMKVTVYGEDDLGGEFLVDASGQVQFPLIGQVPAAGLSVHEFVDKLTAVLGSKYLKDPKVSVEIENYRPFYIIGEVNKPGEYPYEHDLNVLGAVALAGGYTYRANDSDVYIRRNGVTKENAMPITGDTKIYPGDVVRIPERIF